MEINVTDSNGMNSGPSQAFYRVVFNGSEWFEVGSFRGDVACGACVENEWEVGVGDWGTPGRVGDGSCGRGVSMGSPVHRCMSKALFKTIIFLIYIKNLYGFTKK